MNIILTNLSDKTYQASRFRLNDSAKKFGINEIHSYDFNDIKESSFYKNNIDILQQPKGLGYWLWKPYIILEAMKNLDEGDVVIYSDCGVDIIDSIASLTNICHEKEPVLLFGNCNEINLTWTKRDCFALMHCDNEYYWNGPHVDAAFALFRKSDLSVQFLSEWLKFGSDDRIITDLPNTTGLENLTGYSEHRWDQSILSLLAQRYNISLYRLPTQFGNHYKSYEWRSKDEFNCISQSNQQQVKYYSIIPYYNSPYGQLLNHHREKANQPVKANNTNSDRSFKSIAKKLFTK